MSGPDRSVFSVAGTGMLTLDFMEQHGAECASPGGSFGNVVSVLSWLGWHATPVSMMGTDEWSSVLYRHMNRLGMETSCLFRSDEILTPFVVFRQDPRTGDHWFEWRCRACDARFPKYTPLSPDLVYAAETCTASNNVFYFDRAYPTCISLAERAKSGGSLVYFEPSVLDDPTDFDAAIEIADVVKHSAESFENVVVNNKGVSILTRGSEGASIWVRGQEHSIPGFSCERFVDAAGAGDWTSAGFLHALAPAWKQQREIQVDDAVAAIRYGQAWGALNCQFPGALTMLGSTTPSDFMSYVDRVLAGDICDIITNPVTMHLDTMYCSSCGQSVI